MMKFLALLIAVFLGFGLAIITGANKAKTDTGETTPSLILPFEGINGDTKLEFELNGVNGVVSAQDFNGDYVLVGFGFTQCPDVCPIMTHSMGHAVDASDKLRGLFISVDNERDTPEIANTYASWHHKKIIGVTGNHAQLTQAAKNMKARFVVTKTDNSYDVSHSSVIYLFGPDQSLIDTFAMNTEASEILAKLR